MTKSDKLALETLALVQILPEKIEELSSSDKYGSLFRFALKKRANDFIKECDRVINLTHLMSEEDINALIFELNKRVSESIDELMAEV